MKINYSLITNVSHDRFDYQGKTWTLEQDDKSKGLGPFGLWSAMTNGTDKAIVYKADVIKEAGHKVAASLFN